MADEERWRSLEDTIFQMRGRTAALEMIVTELMVAAAAGDPDGTATVTSLRKKMLQGSAAAEGVLRTEERAMRQNDAIHEALGDIFGDILRALKQRPIPPEAGKE